MSLQPKYISDLRPDSLSERKGCQLLHLNLVFRTVLPGICLITTMLLIGCGQEENITTYRVPKPHVIHESNPPAVSKAQDDVRSFPTESTPATPARMLGAVVPGEGKSWFFKLTGNPDAAAGIAPVFETFIQSIKFANGTPSWTTPEGWQQLPDDDPKNAGIFPRVATLMISTEGEPLELSVTSLNGDGGGLLSNINRWRGQMSLPPLKEIQPDDALKQLTVEGKTATLVNLLGTSRSRSMGGRPPFASGTPPTTPTTTPSKPPSAPSKAPLTYTVPEGWTPGKGNIFSVAAFGVSGSGGTSVEITITPAGGDPISNINRWRGQIKLKPVSEAALKSELKTIDVDGIQASYVELVGPESAEVRQSILGVLAEKSGTTWFIKLRGDAELASKEKENFETFVRSIRFSKTDGGR